MERKGLWSVSLLLILAMIPMTHACRNQDLGGTDYSNPIKIGLMAPITDDRGFSEMVQLGAILAAEEINAAGGVLGRSLEVVTKNDGGTEAQGKIAANSFLSEGIKLINGAGWSGVTMPVAEDVAVPNGMLMISYSATNPLITDIDDIPSGATVGLLWRSCPSDAFQGQVGAQYIYNTLGLTTAGIIYRNDTYGAGLAQSFAAAFATAGGTVMQSVSYSSDAGSTYDFSDELDTLFGDATPPQLIYIICFAVDGAKLTNDIANGSYIGGGYQPQFFSVDGIGYSENFLFNGSTPVLEGMLGTYPTADPADLNPPIYKRNHQLRFARDPFAWSYYAYDNMYLLAYAMLTAGSTAPLDIAAVLEAVSGPPGTDVGVDKFAIGKAIIAGGGAIDYSGATGGIDLDSNGDPGTAVYTIWEIQSGAYTTRVVLN